MAQGDKTKEVAFKLWLEGKPVAQIQEQIQQVSTMLKSNVKGWVVDWERGKQGGMEPQSGLTNRLRKHNVAPT